MTKHLNFSWPILLFALTICWSCKNDEFAEIKFSRVEISNDFFYAQDLMATLEGEIHLLDFRSNSPNVKLSVVWTDNGDTTPTISDHIEKVEEEVANDAILTVKREWPIEPGILYHTRIYVEIEDSIIYGKTHSLIVNWVGPIFQEDSIPGRSGATTFMNSGKVFLCFGNGADGFLNDTWQFNGTEWSKSPHELENINWTNAVGFALGSKGYAGLGIDGSGNLLNSFYAFDPADGWEPIDTMSTLPPSGRSGAIAFATSTKGYVGFGRNASTYFDSLYAFDPTVDPTDRWKSVDIQGSPPSPRANAVAVLIGDIAYIGLGRSENGLENDFFAFNANDNFLEKKKEFPLAGREGSIGFTLNGKVYIGLGVSNQGIEKDVWEYDPQTDEWKMVGEFPGEPRVNATAFGLNDKAIIGLGNTVNEFFNDWYEFTPTK